MEGRGFKSDLGLGFFRVYVSPRIYVISMQVVVISLLVYSFYFRPKKKSSVSHFLIYKTPLIQPALFGFFVDYELSLFRFIRRA